jgi:chemotaxis protein CheD
MTETMVRMGELAVSASTVDVLVSLGLGSCIGPALLDRQTGVAGLAHVVLPDSGGHARDQNPFKFADHAVPELIERVVRLGARRPKLGAVLVGGASMFAISSTTLEVGQRNEAAVREQLKARGIPVIATETGGNRGRTIRVYVTDTRVTVRSAGGQDTDLLQQSATNPNATRNPEWRRPDGPNPRSR